MLSLIGDAMNVPTCHKILRSITISDSAMYSDSDNATAATFCITAPPETECRLSEQMP